VADYTELLNMAPGTFSVNPNGVGLGDGKTYFRGFKDGQYTMQADGIPFNDTNDPTHHSVHELHVQGRYLLARNQDPVRDQQSLQPTQHCWCCPRLHEK